MICIIHVSVMAALRPVYAAMATAATIVLWSLFVLAEIERKGKDGKCQEKQAENY
jgi:hypothetical protein